MEPHGDALLGTFSDGRRNNGLMRALTGATQIQDVPVGFIGNTSSFIFRLDAGDLFGGSKGALDNAHPNSRFEISVDGPSGDGIHWEGYESKELVHGVQLTQAHNWYSPCKDPSRLQGIVGMNK